MEDVKWLSKMSYLCETKKKISENHDCKWAVNTVTMLENWQWWNV